MIHVTKCKFDKCFAGKVFNNSETFGQYPLNVNGFKDIHESLEAATVQAEIETVNGAGDDSQRTCQEVSKK